jgi:hypothetical protein
MDILLAIAGLITTVLGFLSYNHYASFQKLAVAFFAVMVIGMMLSSGWNGYLYKLSDKTRSAVEDKVTKVEAELSTKPNKDYEAVVTDTRIYLIKSELSSVAANAVLTSTIDIMLVFKWFAFYWAVLTILLISPKIIKDHPYNKK